MWGYVLAVIVVVIVNFLAKHRTYLFGIWNCSRALKQFPMTDYHWFFGHLAVHPGMSHEGFVLNDEWVKRFPRYYGFYFGPMRPALALNHPDTVKELTRTHEPKPVHADGSYKLLMPWIGDGLLTSFGAKWQRNRKLLTPGFHFDILKSYVAVNNTCTEHLLDNLRRASSDPETSVDVFPLVSLCTLDVIQRCAFSTEEDVQTQGEDNPYVRNVLSLAGDIIYRGLRPHLYADALYFRTAAGRRFRERCEVSHRRASR